MYGLVFANGDLNDGPAVRVALAVTGPRLVIAADGGLRHVAHFELVPNLVVGDMDSADPELLAKAEQQGAQIARYPFNKDETDLELALLAAAQNDCNPIKIIGAVGNRLDQTLGNMYLLALPVLRGRDVQIVCFAQRTWLAYPGETVIHGQPGDTVSLIPLAGDVTDISTLGLAYPLQNETLAFGPARGMSNVLNETEARITFESGLLLVTFTLGRA